MVDPNPAGDFSKGARVLRAYWTRGPGRAKWVHADHPWTTLYGLLTKYLGPERAKGAATQYYVAVFGSGPSARNKRKKK